MSKSNLPATVPSLARAFEAEREALIGWLEKHATRIDLESIPRDPGRLTIRRLNRNEYNNTMRDLFGINFRPGKNFPADGAGGAGIGDGEVTEGETCDDGDPDKPPACSGCRILAVK